MTENPNSSTNLSFKNYVRTKSNRCLRENNVEYHVRFCFLVFKDVLPPPVRLMDPGLYLCSGLLFELFQTAHIR